MADLLPALPPLLGSTAALFALLLLRRPLGALLRLLGRSAAGFCLLALLGRTGLLPGLGATWFNALVLGVLGAPGFGLLLLVRWLLLT